jgi:hypothetical protein
VSSLPSIFHAPQTVDEDEEGFDSPSPSSTS